MHVNTEEGASLTSCILFGVCNRQELQNTVCSFTSKCCHFSTFFSGSICAHILLIVFSVATVFKKKIEQVMHFKF